MPRRKKTEKIFNKVDVPLAKIIIKVAMWSRINGNAKAYTHLMRTALFMYGRANFMFTVKHILPKRISMREYTSFKEKIVFPLVRQGYFQKTSIGGQLVFFTITEKGKKIADEARLWFDDKNMAIHEYLEKTGKSMDE